MWILPRWNGCLPGLDSSRHGVEFRVECPSWHSDIKWIATSTLATFRLYRHVVNDLQQAIKLITPVRLGDPPLVLVSFTFGTDKMTHWDRIARTGAYQGNLVRRPDGSFLCRDFER